MKGSQILIEILKREGVDIVFGIPGGKILSIFEELRKSGIKFVICHHEQNAVFMAQAHGRLTGKPGVVFVTSGPGCTNTITGLMTANTERDPVIVIGGCVSRKMFFRSTHQGNLVSHMIKDFVKHSYTIMNANEINYVITNAFKNATTDPCGSIFIEIPTDVADEECNDQIYCRVKDDVSTGPANFNKIKNAKDLINISRNPIIFLGQECSKPSNYQHVLDFIRRSNLPVISTFQSTGCIPEELFNQFVGRVGVFRNQEGDRLIETSDLIILIGFNRVEYDPESWNKDKKKIINIDFEPSDESQYLSPVIELIGNIALTLDLLKINRRDNVDIKYHTELIEEINKIQIKPDKIHPLKFIEELHKVIREDDIILCDVGSVYLWIGRYLIIHKPNCLLISNGEQTLGVALPWAISAKLIYPNRRVISISGDGGFLFSCQELKTLMNEGLKITHFIFNDCSYNMVKEEQLQKYGESFGVDYNGCDFVKLAESFGLFGIKVDNPDLIGEVIDLSINADVSVLVDISIDYSSNHILLDQLHDEHNV